MLNKSKILMVVMGMEIGGAETHVLELACELKRMGHDILIASNGGVYERELTEAGIKHFKLPLHNRRLTNMIKSYFALKRIIKNERIDIVHGHARIPSFLCGILHKRMKFPFITTAHWVFNTSGILRYVTNWGQKTIAVSGDIKKYLMDNYNLPEDNISLTINGIDTNKFSDDIDSSDIEREFELTGDKNRIVYVSRMDDDRSLVAFHLAQIANDLDAKIDNLEIVIVGSGSSYERLALLVAAVNVGAKKPLIKLVGARTDINKFIKTGDIFIGVSRAALEAMSAAKPVIVAGNEGYIGIFDEDKLPVSIATNFTCRTCPAPTKELLYQDIIKLMCDSDASELERLGNYARQIILERYSALRMAQDCVCAYESLLAECKHSADVVISGYYGFKNSGDDALLGAIIDNLRTFMPGINICVLSFRPAETQKVYNVQSVSRINYFGIAKAMKYAKLLISGGGSLIQDNTSTQSLLYYLWIINMAKHRGLKTMLYANGIGPVEKNINRKRAAKALSDIDLITLREPESLLELERLGVPANTAIVTADPAFDIEPAQNDVVDNIFRLAGIPKGANMVGISVRQWKHHNNEFEADIAKACDFLYDTLKLTCVFFVMQQPHDINITRNIMSKMRYNSYIITQRLTHTEMLGAISKMEIMVGERLHSLIYATAVGVPFVGIVYEPKVKSFIEYAGQDNYISLDELTVENICDCIRHCLVQKESTKTKLADKAAQLRALSIENAKMAVDLIGGSVDDRNID